MTIGHGLCRLERKIPSTLNRAPKRDFRCDLRAAESRLRPRYERVTITA